MGGQHKQDTKTLQIGDGKMRRLEESIDDILEELRIGRPCGDIRSYLLELANRIDVAHSAGVIKAMDELMGKD